MRQRLLRWLPRSTLRRWKLFATLRRVLPKNLPLAGAGAYPGSLLRMRRVQPAAGPTMRILRPSSISIYRSEAQLMTLKVYYYRDDEVDHITSNRSGLRLESTETIPVQIVQAVDEADLIVSPVALQELPDQRHFYQLPHYAGREARHVFYDCSDYEYTYGGTTSILVRCNLRGWMRNTDPHSISWPWPVEDWGHLPVPDGGLRYDVSFHGWVSSHTRKHAAESCRTAFREKADIVGYKDFYGYVHRDNPGEAERRRQAYIASAAASRLLLCPESIPGVFPYRFYEALMFGRPPILLSSDYVLPITYAVDWPDIAFCHGSNQARHAPDIVRDILARYSEAEILAMGARGRAAWERWLYRDRWNTLFTDAIVQSARGWGILP